MIWRRDSVATLQSETACRKTHGAPLVVVEVGLVHIERCLERDCPMRKHRDNAASIAFTPPPPCSTPCQIHEAAVQAIIAIARVSTAERLRRIEYKTQCPRCKEPVVTSVGE